jgi:hypothetical protein
MTSNIKFTALCIRSPTPYHLQSHTSPDPTEGHPSMHSELTASQPHHQTTSPLTHFRPTQHLGLSRPDQHKLTTPFSTFLLHRADEISALTCTTPNAASGRSVPSVLYGANTGVNEAKLFPCYQKKLHFGSRTCRETSMPTYPHSMLPNAEESGQLITHKHVLVHPRLVHFALDAYKTGD